MWETSGLGKGFRAALDRFKMEAVMGRLGDKAKWMCEVKCMWLLKGATVEDECEEWNCNEWGEEEYLDGIVADREEGISYVLEV